MIYNLPYFAVMGLILVGLFALIFKRNLIKMVIGITLIESGVNLFLITLGYRENSTAPIYTSSPGGIMSLPVPQALTLTSIVIGVAVLALMLSFVILIYRHYKSLDVNEVRRLRE
ncbi:MAG: cation:proton antiporter subunit C [Candidatus Thermoplasmatota archaeon]|nr:cation:proton antiporter subunit C [Candidatus Thermoplasmatota archaeon]MBU1941356.1 cation:proton antiporter subunit C [Candidatus Thermoplasmatota archaeon]